MANTSKIRTSGSTDQAQTGLAVELKRQMNDLIDIAYKDESPPRIRQFKRFTIFCTTNALSSRHGDCLVNPDKSSSLRILNLAGRNPNDILITTIHEVCHHIDFSLRGTTNHDKNFYAVMKQLLSAAIDMGILTMNDLVDADRIEESHSRSRGKIGRMMAGYVPQPVAYKKDVVSVSVYNCFSVRDHLKKRGFLWNGLDKSWTKEIVTSDLDAEKKYILSLGVLPQDIKEHSLKGVSIRQRKIVHLYNVPFESNSIVKEMGFQWSTSGKKKHWEKRISEEDLSAQERMKLEQIPNVLIKIV